MGIPDQDMAAVRRDLEALKKNPAKMDQISKMAMMHGYFIALEQARIDGSVGPALFRHHYRRYYDMLQEAIREAQTETERIRATLSRMQAAANNGSRRVDIPRLTAHPDDAQFQDGLKAFQGWLISLYETYITMFGMIQGVNGATRVVDELGTASKALLNKRLASNSMFTKSPELFKALTE